MNHTLADIDHTFSDVESVEEEKEETSDEKLSSDDFRHREELAELNKVSSHLRCHLRCHIRSDSFFSDFLTHFFQLREELQNYKINDDDIKTLTKIVKPAEPLVFLYQAIHLLKEGNSHGFA